MTLIDLALALGVGLVLPAALGGAWRRWAVAAACVLGACVVERGSALAVALTLPFGFLAADATVRALPDAALPSRWGSATVARVASGGFAVVAWTGLAASCADLHLFGVADPFNQLAAIHFTFVGGGAVPLAASALAEAVGSRAQRVGQVALALSIGAPPVVAVGFIADLSGLLLAGAVLLTIGVWCTAALELRRAVRSLEPTVVRVLLAVSGLAVVAPMVLAVLWAAGQRWNLPVLSIPAMVSTHGAGNGIGFVGAGLLAVHLARGHKGNEQEVATWS